MRKLAFVTFVLAATVSEQVARSLATSLSGSHLATRLREDSSRLKATTFEHRCSPQLRLGAVDVPFKSID